MKEQPLVSVIIPCYNHGKYLAEAVASIYAQTYNQTEIIVVDDGSSDNTRAVAESLQGVVYIWQENKGLSAARNTGFRHCHGDYVVFLDADDYLYPRAIETNLKILTSNPALAFVSGGHDKVDNNGKVLPDDSPTVVEQSHYTQLLMGNYIGMHATVMYTRRILLEYSFDTSLKACEDYDLYFRISRKFPVAHHNEKIAAYRIHGTNMSANIPFMLRNVLDVHRRQYTLLRGQDEKRAFEAGIKIWKDYYRDELYKTLYHRAREGKLIPAKDAKAMFALSAAKTGKLYYHTMKHNTRKLIKQFMPSFLKKELSKRGYIKSYVPEAGQVSWGDLDRTTPLSNQFGYDRGGPVDRYYIEKFLADSTGMIYGRVLEIGDNDYTLRYGKGRVTKSDVLHVYQANDTVTFIGDLTNAPHIPDNAFDCIILTQTLHLIFDFKAALKTCYRVLKPGGCLLLTVPGISPIDKDEWKENWLWSFTAQSMKLVFREVFAEERTEINAHGNVYAATAFLYGLGLPEVDKQKLEMHDASYPVIITVRAVK